MAYLSEIGSLYLVVTVASDDEENAFLGLMASADISVPSHVSSMHFHILKLFAVYSFVMILQRILFCETEIGKKAIIRQLEPCCFMDRK